MTILDRYIAWKFTFFFVLWSLLLFVFYIVIHLFSNFDSFVGRTNMQDTIMIISQFYLVHFFPLLNIIAPFLFLIAAINMLSTMEYGNEIIALMANGVSRVRMLLPLFIMAFIYSLLFLVIRETIVPQKMREIIREPDDYFETDRSLSVKSMKDYVSNFRLGGERVDYETQEIISPIITFPNNISKYGTKLTAEKAKFYPAVEGRQAGWLIRKVISPVKILEEKSFGKYILTPKDLPDFLKADECFFISGLPFEVMAVGDSWVRYASMLDLIQASENQSLHFSKNELLATVHNRIIRPVIDMLPFFFCLPLIFFRNDKNVSRDILICIVITFLFIGLQYASAYLWADYDPMLAAWIPVLIFIPISYCIFTELVIAPRVLLTSRKLS